MKPFYSIVLAILSGMLLWAAWPTYGFAGLLFIAFVPLLIAEKRIRTSQLKRKNWRLLGLSYVCFFIWNIGTTSWLYYASGFGMWFAVLANSLLMSLVFLGYHLLAKKATQGAALSFLVCLWISFERMHLHWDFSWPWLNLGNGFSENISLIQWYEFTGTMGGTLWVWLINVTVFLAVTSATGYGFTIKKDKPTLVKLTVAAVVIVLPILGSLYLRSIVETAIHTNAQVVVIVQPNIDPYRDKYTTSNSRVLAKIQKLAQPVLTNSTAFLITPETVLAEPLRLTSLEREEAIYNIKQFIYPYNKVSYLGGAVVLDVFSNPKKKTPQSNNTDDPNLFYNDYNSALFITKTDSIALYHKSKLVVGVENMPYKALLEPLLGPFMIDLGGTVSTKTTQKERTVFKNADNVAVAPIICYESVYGEYVTGYVKNGAQFLSIITNDAWWDNTQGHKQHLSIARLRAIENRKWVTRSANTGISAVINPAGTITKSLPYGTSGVIKATVQPNDIKTFYSIHGDYIARVASILGLFILLFAVFKKGAMKRK